MARRPTPSRRRSAATPVMPAPDVPKMEAAVREFLTAAGLDPASNPELGQTPQLVARAWTEDFLNGYRLSPRDLLAERSPMRGGPHDEMVVLAKLTFQSVCPHHLLPYEGLAHVAYVPESEVVGFGQIVKLLDCLGHRLVLQEDLARQVATSLVSELGARGAAVLLEAGQSCMILRGGRRTGSKVIAEAYEGVFGQERELRERFLSVVRGG